MKVLGIIPARYASSRFPGKPLIDLAGKSMIQRVYEGAKQCKDIHELVVATDDQRIFEHVKLFGGNVMMTSENHLNGTERCGEVIEKYADFEVVLNIQGDEPLVQAEQLSQLIQLFEQEDVQIGTLAKEMKEDIANPNRVKVVMDAKGDALYFSRSAIPYNKTNTIVYKHIGLYAWRLDILKKLLQLKPSSLELAESLEQLRWLEASYKIRVGITQIETPNIDTKEDVQLVLDQLN